ncbi:glycoside hydrolase family 19 protein [Ideonella paludis]|uniref:PKD domain-containing protein n=2 Tax=Ideonella paludis TaxID=1233411 RepID=A0ABS5DRH3_9BURK|nr:glycoside hydrolase family 19 protein [Ideonella paludis]MBQ0933743.1 PKD domain-containing protein [Ideonella paludis]
MLTVCAPSPAPKTPRLLCAGQAGQRPLATGLMARAALGTLLMCSAAAQAQVVDCSALPIWNASAIYTGGKQAQDSGKAYQANWWTQNQPPASNSGAGAVWKLLGTCNSGGGGGGPGGNKAPVANFTATIDHLSVALDGSSSKDADGSISSYQWNFGDGGSGTGAKASRSYATPGTYPVTLTVTDNQGAKNSKSQSVTVASVVKDPVTGKYVLKQADVLATEARLTDTPLFRSVKASVATRDNTVVAAVKPGLASNPENVKRVERLLPASQWEYLFPLRDPSYTYTGLLQAMAKFSGVCMTYTDGRDSDAICRKTLATMFAHFTQETGAHDRNNPIPEWRQALYFVRESGCSESTYGCPYNNECLPSTWQGQTWPCGKDAQGRFKQYFGRGAKQLSYNYNYGPFSDAMYGDVKVLLNNPEQVADTWLNLASAVFFYVYPASPKPSMLHVVDGTWKPNAVDTAAGIKPGFGATTNIINGGIECNTGGVEKPQSVNRIAYYRQHAAALGVPIASTEELGCANQRPFTVGGAGALDIYWDQDWSYQPNMPEGKSFACKLVGYQTAYFSLKAGDYQRCVEHYFDVVVKP